MNKTKSDVYWMEYALSLAKIGQKKGEVPIGAVLILSGKIIGKGWNCSIKTNDPTAHAEIIALRNGGKFIKNYRLLDATLYVTLEPCMMCLGAMLHSRIDRLVYGATNKNTIKHLLQYVNNYKDTSETKKMKFVNGILTEKCSYMIKKFFYIKRKK